MDFPQILQEFLREQGLSQSAFAAKVGIKQSQVSEWLRGKAKPGYDLLKQMCQAFCVTADYWLGLCEQY